MKIGLIGHDGFIGKHLKNKLISLDNIELILFNRNKHSLLNLKSLKDFVKKTDIVIHAAGVNRGSDEDITKGNVLITENLLKAVKEYKPSVIIYYLSSTQAVDNFDSTYGISKRFTEILLEYYYFKYLIRSKVFRLTNVFGPGCKPFYNSVVATFCSQVAMKKDIKVNRSKRKYSFVYVDDVIAKIIKSMKNQKKGYELIQVLSNNQLTISDLANIIKSFNSKIKKDEIIKRFSITQKFYNQLLVTFNSYKKNHE